MYVCRYVLQKLLNPSSEPKNLLHYFYNSGIKTKAEILGVRNFFLKNINN